MDTNVIAYRILRTEPFRTESTGFWSRRTALLAPVHWQAEFANVVWLAARTNRITAMEAVQSLVAAEHIPIIQSPIQQLWTGAVERSLATGLAVYDTLFVELASQRGFPLVTFDKAVLRAYPHIACQPRDLA